MIVLYYGDVNSKQNQTIFVFEKWKKDIFKTQEIKPHINKTSACKSWVTYIQQHKYIHQEYWLQILSPCVISHLLLLIVLFNTINI